MPAWGPLAEAPNGAFATYSASRHAGPYCAAFCIMKEEKERMKKAYA
jgi:hypothetical protein